MCLCQSVCALLLLCVESRSVRLDGAIGGPWTHSAACCACRWWCRALNHDRERLDQAAAGRVRAIEAQARKVETARRHLEAAEVALKQREEELQGVSAELPGTMGARRTADCGWSCGKVSVSDSSPQGCRSLRSAYVTCILPWAHRATASCVSPSNRSLAPTHAHARPLHPRPTAQLRARSDRWRAEVARCQEGLRKVAADQAAAPTALSAQQAQRLEEIAGELQAAAGEVRQGGRWKLQGCLEKRWGWGLHGKAGGCMDTVWEGSEIGWA